MKKCPSCHSEFGDGATYCDKCGAKLEKVYTCPHCGAELTEDAIFCSRCGKSVNSNEVVSSVIAPKESSNVDNKTIERYKREIAIYRAKRKTFLILGSIFLGVGLTLFILFTSLMITTADKMVQGNYYDSLYVTYIFLMILSELILDVGIVFMIIQGAVFAKKIANRERIINEHSNR